LGKKGEGTFSEVLKCQDLKEGALHACKKLKHHYKRWALFQNFLTISSLSEYTFLGKVGEGTFSEVIRCKLISDGSQ
jgi:hypothetical protein